MPIPYIQIIKKSAHLNFVMGAVLYWYATARYHFHYFFKIYLRYCYRYWKISSPQCLATAHLWCLS